MCCSGSSLEKALRKPPSKKKINVMPSYPPNGESQNPSGCRSDHDSLLQCHSARTFLVTFVSKNTPIRVPVLGKKARPQLPLCVEREPSRAQGSGCTLGGCCGLLGTSSEAPAAFPPRVAAGLPRSRLAGRSPESHLKHSLTVDV